MDLAAVILAGGESKRMGRDKAWVEFGGKPLLAHAVEKVRLLGVKEIFISGRINEDYSALQYPVLLDLKPGLGPLGGIERGLHKSTASLVLVLAVDLPRMTTAFLERMRAHSDPWTGIVPELNGDCEPVAAIYPKRSHSVACGFITQPRRAARGFAHACLRMGMIRMLPVTGPEAECFSNWNGPADIICAATA
jgi:molybdopterin-guanine dinucleotide biosynthesis protein A